MKIAILHMTGKLSNIASYALPTMTLNPAVKDIFAFRYEDFKLENYDPHPHIKAEVAV